MQQAARKVLEENKRLRSLLKRKGVSDEEIDTFSVGSPASTSPPSAPASPAPADYPSPAPSAKLARMLVTRKPLVMNRGSRPTPVVTQTSEPDVLPQQVLPQSQAPMQQAPPQLTPIIPFNNMSHSPQSMSSTVSTPTTILSPEIYSATPTATQSDPGDFALPPTYAFNPSLDNSWHAYQSAVSATSFPEFGYTSCVDAANIIRSMRGEVGVELESDLGCTNLGTDCKVDNINVFNMMDRYSGQPMTTGPQTMWR
jgi:hypothetical protein